MLLEKYKIQELNDANLKSHRQQYEFVAGAISNRDEIIQKLVDFQVAIPSWALGAGGTRFGRFSIGGEPRNLEEKIEDVGLLHALNQSSGAISLHIPWDIPENANSTKALAAQHGLKFDAVNSNTFQDQSNQAHSYKFGSLQHVDKLVRKQAVEHNIEVIKHGIALGSESLTVWLSDGSSFPGQLNFRKAFQYVLEGLKEIYSALPDNWKMFVEYKAFEPNFYSMSVGDWGQSYLYASKLGPKAYTLVDLGHHLPNANIEQIVSLLLMEGKLGGFHFNDRRYADDDLTIGSIDPYQVFRIFHEISYYEWETKSKADIAYMIDQSHNIKDPLEDMLQTVDQLQLAYAKAHLVDNDVLEVYQNSGDVVMAERILKDAFETDVRPLVAEARLRNGAALDPVAAFRASGYRARKIAERAVKAGYAPPRSL